MPRLIGALQTTQAEKITTFNSSGTLTTQPETSSVEYLVVLEVLEVEVLVKQILVLAPQEIQVLLQVFQQSHLLVVALVVLITVVVEEVVVQVEVEEEMVLLQIMEQVTHLL